MRSISGIYTARKKTKSYAIELPSSWEELTPGQFGSAIYMLVVTREADPDWIRLSLLALLFEKHWSILNGLTNDDRFTLLEELTKFFYDQEPPLKNFYPELKAQKFTAAAVDLSNIGFGEWCFLDTYFNFYYQFKDVKWLNRAIATVYRPIDPLADENSVHYAGDLRQLFNENLIIKRSEQIETLSDPVRFAIFQWLSVALKRVKEQRPDAFPVLQPALDEEGNPLPLPETDPADVASWMDIFSDLLGPKFGTHDQLKHTNAMLVLDYLNKEQINYKKIKSSMA